MKPTVLFLPSRCSVLATAFLSLASGALAQAPGFKIGAIYECAGGQCFQVAMCTGSGSAEMCGVQTYVRGQPAQRVMSTRPQLMALLPSCHLQTPQEAQAAARTPAPPAPAAAQTSANGIKVGDNVEVVTGFGWTPAKVLAINGNSYRVLTNGVQVTKDYPSEVRRLGGATAQDHTAGQYRLGDRVQVNVQGTWVEGKITTEMGSDYQVSLPGNRTAWATGQNLRALPDAPAPAAPKAGVPPKPRMTSCAGKIEGRYATTGSAFASFTITFRSGKATLIDVGSNEDNFECWMAGEKILLHQPGKSNMDMPIDINNDGTLQTPLGEIKKKGN